MITAEIVADSTNKFGNRITTFVLQFPRIVLAEFNTHRMISRNSASSRAIPFAKMLQRVLKDPFIPIAWMKDHSGMQGNQFYTGFKVILFKQMWLTARNLAVVLAWSLSKLGLTKQIVNRLLEPFMWHTVICTGTEWENFFALRAHPAAEIHIAKLAEFMLEEYNKSIPKEVEDGEWHIPFGDKLDDDRIKDMVIGIDERCVHFDEEQWSKIISEDKIKIATARCARVSYLNFEGKDDYAADIKLHDNLSKMGHMSPFEHCAKPMTDSNYNKYQDDGWCGNFRGFVQYRKMLKGENKTDDRVIKVKIKPPVSN